MKNLRSLVAIFICITVLASCNDSDKVPLQGIGDVFVRSVKDGDQVKYAPVFYVHSNYYLKKAMVKGPGDNGMSYELKDFGKIAFRLVPEASDFTTVDLPNGVYDFKIISEDQDTLTFQDKLLETRMVPMELTTFTYKKDMHSFELDWEDVENADSYVVKIMEKVDGAYLYVSNQLKESKFDFNIASAGWYNFNKEEGKTYVLGVFAYQFENKNVPSGNDINSETVVYRDIVW